MAHYKLILNEDSVESYDLIAIHCSEEAYKLAYLLNKRLHFKMQRRRLDLDYSKNGLEITFPLFQYEDHIQYTTYALVANKCNTLEARIVASGNLFGTEVDDTVTKFLLKEFNKVDYFLKITSENDYVPIRKLLMELNEINQIISAYAVEMSEVKSKDNLIFD